MPGLAHSAPLVNDFAALCRLLDENEHGGTEETEATQRRRREDARLVVRGKVDWCGQHCRFCRFLILH
jgi:hypothetical protein